MLKTIDMKLVTCAGERTRVVPSSMLGMARKATFAVRITVAFGVCFNGSHKEMRKRPYDPAEFPPLILGLGEEVSRPSKTKKKDHHDVTNKGNFALTCSGKQRSP